MNNHFGLMLSSRNSLARHTFEIELQHSPPRPEFRSCFVMRWIFRLIVMTVAAKLVNRYLGSRHPQPRSQR
jgi:hypothetical protein